MYVYLFLPLILIASFKPDCSALPSLSCSKIINGYEHFANAGSNAKNGSEAGATCPLWDDTGRRNFEGTYSLPLLISLPDKVCEYILLMTFSQISFSQLRRG
jgi:hypothetical protein